MCDFPSILDSIDTDGVQYIHRLIIVKINVITIAEQRKKSRNTKLKFDIREKIAIINYNNFIMSQ